MMRRRNRPGFTLVEMLTVILVIAVLVTLVVGISSTIIRKANVERTKVTMTAVMSAVQAYQQANGQYPPPLTPTTDDTDNKILMTALLTDAQAGPIASKLADDLKGTVPNAIVVDGFGNTLKYLPDGGAGGTPVLISPGPDGDFGDTDTAKANDNIRSDNR